MRNPSVPCSVCRELKWYRSHQSLQDNPICRDCRREGHGRKSPCVDCGAEFVRPLSNGRRKRCDECLSKWHSKGRCRRSRTCKHCAAPIDPGADYGRLHCDECASGMVWLPGFGKGAHKKPGDNARKRARRFNVEYEPVDKGRVFVRDKWRCGICKKSVDKQLKYPDRLSASLDHVLPMSKGGGHTYANTQCSHLKCNVDKGNRSHGEQLALVG